MCAPVDDSGATLRSVLISQMERAEARGDFAKADALAEHAAGPGMPAGGGYLWSIYESLLDEREYAGMGQPVPLRAASIIAWCRLYGRRMSPWDAETIKAMDRACLAGQAKKE